MFGKLLRFAPAALWMGVIYRASATPGLKSVPLVQRLGLLPADLAPEVGRLLELLIRKSAHVATYAVLALLLAWALAGLLERGRALRLAFLLSLLYAASDEYHQSFVPDRSGNWIDVLIDTGGVCLGLLAWLWRAHKRAPQAVRRR